MRDNIIRTYGEKHDLSDQEALGEVEDIIFEDNTYLDTFKDHVLCYLDTDTLLDLMNDFIIDQDLEDSIIPDEEE